MDKDKCKGCNNSKGCVTCVDGSEWAHYHYDDEPKIPQVFDEGYWERLGEDPISEELEEAANAYISNETNYSHSRTDTFKAGAKWKEEQFEKNRIEHCEDITEEQYNLETEFVDLYIKRLNRLPTILDAIEYGKTLGEMLMIGEAVETTFNVSLPCGVYDKLKAKGCEDGDKLLIIKKED